MCPFKLANIVDETETTPIYDKGLNRTVRLVLATYGVKGEGDAKAIRSEAHTVPSVNQKNH